jgi:hypothetical protein
MLLTIKGLSAEKVAFLIAPGTGFPTPRALYEAFKKDEARETREKQQRDALGENGAANGGGRKRVKKIRPARELLCELGGSGRGKIGPILSGTIYELIMGNY